MWGGGRGFEYVCFVSSTSFIVKSFFFIPSVFPFQVRLSCFKYSFVFQVLPFCFKYFLFFLPLLQTSSVAFRKWIWSKPPYETDWVRSWSTCYGFPCMGLILNGTGQPLESTSRPKSGITKRHRTRDRSSTRWFRSAIDSRNLTNTLTCCSFGNFKKWAVKVIFCAWKLKYT